MTEVYGNSFCNIAATSASDGRLGCLIERKLTKDDEPCIEIDVGSDSCLGVKSIGVNSPLISGIEQSVLESPLLERAWVIQELILAPRTLHFTSSEIIFECSQIAASQSYSDGLVGQYGEIQLCKIDLPQSLPLSSSGEHSTSLEKMRILESWHHMVRLYSKGRLSFAQQDKLVAIRGLASSLCDLKHYACGLWKFFMQEQLFWDVPTHSPGRTRDRLGFPSWSWASVDGEVFPGYSDYDAQRDDCRIREISQGYTEKDGTVQGAYLRTDVMLFRARFSPLEHIVYKSRVFHDSLYSPAGRAQLHIISCDQQQPTSIASEDGSCLCPCHSSWCEVTVKISLDSSNQHSSESFYCAILSGGTDWTFRGLLLSPAYAKGSWVRVGVASFEIRYQANLIATLCKENEADIVSQPELYEEFIPSTVENPQPRYVIKIV